MEVVRGDGILGAVYGRWHQVSKVLQYYLDKSVPHVVKRWIGSLGLALVYGVRVYSVQGFSIVITSALGIYLLFVLNEFLSFLTDLDAILPDLPVQTCGEGKPFVRRFPEFKLWRGTTEALAIAFLIILFPMFDIPEFIKSLMLFLVSSALIVFTMFEIMCMFRYYNPFISGESKKIKYGGTKAAAAAAAAAASSATAPKTHQLQIQLEN